MKNLSQWQESASKKAGHKVGVSRRDLLAHGFFAAAATMLVPRWAHAFDCGGGAGANSLPFMTFDMAGGAAIAGNCLVGKSAAKDLLRAYDILGWDPRAAGALDERFGLPMSANNSKLLAGMVARMSPEAQARLRLGSVCHFSQLDTSGNKLNIASLVASAGGVGTTVNKGFANKNSPSGGNSDSLTSFPTMTPIAVKSVDDVVGAARFGGTSLASLTPAHRAELASSARDLSLAQREAIKKSRGGDVLYDLAGCVYDKDMDYANGGEAALDPRRDVAAQAAFGLTPTTATTDMNAVAAGVIVNAVQGRAGAGVWTLGDCDYHTGEQTKGDKQDGLMGDTIGRAVEYAHRIQKPFFFHLLTDGSCSANRGTRNWSQDTNEGVSLFGYYLPTAAPRYVRDMQVGAFTDGQTVDRATTVGSAARLGALAVFANYCNVAGKMADFNRLTGNAFTADQLRQILVFEGQGAT